VAKFVRPKKLSPGWLLVAILLTIFFFGVARSFRLDLNPRPPALLSPVFTREVQYWQPQIVRWATQYNVDPDLVATLMQIESCGLQSAESYVGAQGLFQVMPFHFSEDEQTRMKDPEINAKHGMEVISDCLWRADGDVGFAMACYNAGPSWLGLPITGWPDETQRYYFWGGGIYRDAKLGLTRSASLDGWLQSGGWSLCQQAAVSLNLPTQPAPTAVQTVFPTVAPIFPTVPNSNPGALPTFDPGGSSGF
jgi:hypothetical protein